MKMKQIAETKPMRSNTSHYVLLPSSWCKIFGVQRRTKLQVFTTEQGDLIVRKADQTATCNPFIEEVYISL